MTVWDTNGRVIARTTTESDGTWQIFPVSPGTVMVCFDAIGRHGPSSLGYQSQCYNNLTWNGTSAPSATQITLNPGTVVTNVNASLVTFSAIAGTITDSVAHSGVFNVKVNLYSVNGTLLKSTITQADGTYTLARLVQNAYLLCFDARNAAGPSATGYLSQCYLKKAWDGVTKPSPGSPQLDTIVSVPASGVKVIDAALTPKP